MENSNVGEVMASYLESPSREKKREVVNAVASYVFFNLKRILANAYPSDEDTRSDFFLWLYPQLERIVDRFDAQKACLSTYVSAGVKFRYIRFCAERAKAASIRAAAESEEMKFSCGYKKDEPQEELCACESPLQYNAPCALNLKEASEAAKRRMKRDMLLLALKSAFYLSEELIEKVCAFCEIPRESFDELLERVRCDYGARQDAYEELKMRKYCYYIKAFSCRKKLSEIKESCSASDAEKIERMEKEQAFCERQEERLKRKMEKMQRNPSNRYLAGLLGMPRGSVNSALVRIKKHLYAFENEDSSSDF